ncbi:unnamed protein product [Zymoseptoria tritici ST99CH_1A5]|uniref:Uncharacterized protein n=1 Tax=Zymoseptoria tritici ST99CH_1A5 TaxID=1276529 RepID=A0A1Y6LMT0_ZYMTR|nr:unnamed protein product [Zymoseptoria tritici ST99CH_1A5]
MLTFGLRRAQLDLQCHRLWLRSFSSAHSPGAKSVRAQFTLDRHKGITRPLRKDGLEELSERGWKKGWQNGSTDDPPKIAKSPAQQRKRERKINRVLGAKLRDAPESRILKLEALGAHGELLDAVSKEDIKGVIQAYSSLPEKKPLSSEDFHAVAQCTHACLRFLNLEYLAPHLKDSKKGQYDTSDIVAFAERLAEDIRRGYLVPNTAAHLHLLGIFRESKSLAAGEKFWRWLQTQDDSHVSTGVYGAAIEIFAMAGRPLQDCEKLYDEALARFPGSFFAYHLSPNAILPDREKPMELKGIPMHLQEAIIRARLLLGDTRNAYLALDTALRLYPTNISHRLLKNFLIERPITEAYTIYAMAYRAGMNTSGQVFKTLMSSLRLASNMTSIPVHFQVLRAMVSMMYVFVGNSKKIPSNTLAELTIAITHIGLLPGVAAMTQRQRDEIFQLVLDIIKTLWDVGARFEATPPASAFVNIIKNIAAPAQSRSIAENAMADMTALGLDPTEATRRAMMNVAGAIADEEMVQSTWDDIVASRSAKGKRPDLIDLNVTIKAARQVGMKAFIQQQADVAKQYLSSKEQSSIDYYTMGRDEVVPNSELARSTAEEILEGVKKLRADLAIFDEKTKDPSGAMDFSKRPGMLLREPSIFAKIPEEEMRRIYDEFTTEQVRKSPSSDDKDATFAEHETSPFSPDDTVPDTDPTVPKTDPIVPDPASTTQPDPSTVTPARSMPLSPTGIPLSTLRYESWRAINALLYHSARNDRAHAAAVDVAIWEGSSPPKRPMGFTGENLEVGEWGFGGVGLREWLGEGQEREEDVGARGEEGEEGEEGRKRDGEESKGDVELARGEIGRLRGRE